MAKSPGVFAAGTPHMLNSLSLFALPRYVLNAIWVCAPLKCNGHGWFHSSMSVARARQAAPSS
eukprot:4519163-Alexandrium_andersonii.AAC.1